MGHNFFSWNKSLSLFYLLLYSLTVLAQKEEAVWYFGQKAGLDFNNLPPTIISTDIEIKEGVAVCNDAQGNTLFYTNGDEVRDRNGNIMLGGTGLGGNPSSTQSSIIVPLPESQDEYLIFTTAAFEENFNEDGLSYSVVDMSENGGLGRVVSKNNVLLVPVCEKLAAVKRCNGEFWLVAHHAGSDRFYSYPVASDGVGDPVVSSTGSRIQTNAPFSIVGEMKFSPQGDHLVTVQGGGRAEYFEFDLVTGKVSNPLILPSFGYGICFSPDGSKLYISEFKNVVQYDLSATSIGESRFVVNEYGPTLDVGSMQKAIDGKIYVMVRGNSYMGLDVIQSPNELEASCDYQQSVISFPYTISLQPFGLPNFPSHPRFESLSNEVDIFSCDADSVVLHQGNDAAEHLWSNGDTNAFTKVAESGIYYVDVTYGGCTYRDSFVVDNSLAQEEKVTNYDWCEGDTILLETALVGDVYTWSTNDTGQAINVANSGTYYLEVSNSFCTYADTFHVNNVLNRPGIMEVLFCAGIDDGVIKEELDGGSYLWSTGDTTQSLTLESTGLYYVDVTYNACAFRDSFYVQDNCICPLYIPSAFSPGTDAINDGFLAQSSCDFIAYSIEIYDRWGMEVFRTDILEPWDGMHNGKSLPLGVYLYRFSGRFDDGVEAQEQGKVILVK